ncbi:mitochondrial intermembrane space import and assembly protein 40 protein [Purpureocillium lavendulum]|uniref:Mitochondrial intermembrane space import and assembly protein 40 protein n=1 Tax=Purpureocillium lavendulum TaxID=1247861 RepID=A0AB34FND0_9HYPO|nr:mitochondrial intermembrane space import and assembly protein 40 protein [Purpureocillium lavendulum]
MSEDDVDMVGPDGQGATRVDRDRRAPRFSWTPAYEATFFRSLCDSVQLGLRENSSFKAEAWERAAQALQESHGAYPAKSHLINKSDNARKRFRLWRGLREDPEFLYNPITRTVTATEEAWRAHIEAKPLSRALRGRPFDHEDFMEILYPDVIGSGGAPKRIMKPKRRTDGQPGDESDMPGTGVINLQTDTLQVQGPDSPERQRASLSQTPTSSAPAATSQSRPPSAVIPPRTTPTQPSALTPPDESANQAKKRALPIGSEGAFEPPMTSSTSTPAGVTSQPASSPEKRRRTSLHSDTLLPASSSTASVGAVPGLAPSSADTTPLSGPDGHILGTKPTSPDGIEQVKPHSSPLWQEMALDLFFKEFAEQDLDLQVKIAETVLCDEHRALVFCKMPWRVRQHWVKRLGEAHHKTAAAPAPPEVVTTESASTASLIDVDAPSVHTVPSDFLEQDVQTETQAQRRERESAAAEAKAKAEKARRDAAAKARRADNWLTAQFSKLSDGSAGALALANVAAVVGLSSYLGYRAWGLYEKGRLDWKTAGVGVGILAAVGAVESVFGGYLYKGKKKGGSS